MRIIRSRLWRASELGQIGEPRRLGIAGKLSLRHWQTKCTFRKGGEGRGVCMPRPRIPASPFRYFNSSPEVIRLVVMMYVKYPLSLRNVEDLVFERG